MSFLAYRNVAGVSTQLGVVKFAFAGSTSGGGGGWTTAAGCWERIVGVQVDGAMHALVTYRIPLFDVEKSAVAVACPRSKMEEIGGFL
jgi:hypothetical protein